MVDEIDSFSENFQIYALYVVVGLVVVHCDSGSEKHCRDLVIYKDFLVGKAVEHLCEVLASVIREGDLEVETVDIVAGVEELPVHRTEGVAAEHYYIVFPVLGYGGEGAAYLVYVYHKADIFLLDRVASVRIDELFVLYQPPERFRACHIHYFCIEGDEDYVLEVTLAHRLHRCEHIDKGG